MALGSLDQINGAFINRGTGFSGMRQRALQQAQIEDLNSLGKSLAQSQAAMRSLESSREQSFNKMKVANLAEVGKSLSRNGSGGANVSNMPGNKRFKAQVLNTGDQLSGISRDFELTDTLNANKRRFKTMNELQFYLNQLGKNTGSSGQEQNLDFINPELLSQFEQRQAKNFF